MELLSCNYSPYRIVSVRIPEQQMKLQLPVDLCIYCAFRVLSRLRTTRCLQWSFLHLHPRKSSTYLSSASWCSAPCVLAHILVLEGCAHYAQYIVTSSRWILVLSCTSASPCLPVTHLRGRADNVSVPKPIWNRFVTMFWSFFSNNFQTKSKEQNVLLFPTINALYEISRKIFIYQVDRFETFSLLNTFTSY